MKIFAAVGTQKYPFNRLIDILDDISRNEGFDVFIQYGNSKKPSMCKGAAFLESEEYREMLSNADVVITHGGVGTMRAALSFGTKVVAIPRRAAIGEHVDDHQLEIVAAFAEGGYIMPCYDLDQLVETIKAVAQRDFPRFEPMPCAIEEEILKLAINWGFDSMSETREEWTLL